MARRIYEKDRWTEAPAISAVQHMGYAGLNGGSRPVLSALKKYGLVEYIGSSANMRVKLTDLAKRILLPVNEAERAAAVREALSGPEIHAELIAEFPNWELPSEETLAARLEREFGLQHAAVMPFVSDLRESLNFVRGFETSHEETRTESENGSGGTPLIATANKRDETHDQAPAGMMKLPMPGSTAYIVLPESMQPAEARRLLSWLKRVVTPAVEFASGEGESDEAE